MLETRQRRVGVVGLAFKPGTDDLRESPMVTLVETLIGKGCDVRILDQSVAIARLVGANRRYIEEEIPHISALMCDERGGADRPRRGARRRCRGRGGGARPRSRAARPGGDRPDAGRRARPARRGRGVVSPRVMSARVRRTPAAAARRARDGTALPRGGRRARAAARGGRGAGRRAVGAGHRGALRAAACRPRSTAPRRATSSRSRRAPRLPGRSRCRASRVRGSSSFAPGRPRRSCRPRANASAPRTRASCRSWSRRRDP